MPPSMESPAVCAQPRTSRATILAWSVLMALLVVVRLPSLVQPAGADQGLYAYVGSRILEGKLPYRDAWDQKPPAIHYIYALMYDIWPHQSVVATADLVVAASVAFMLVPLGRALTGIDAAGRTAAALFLLLGDPTLSRLAGVRVRSQCETFIALAVTAALLLAVASRREPGAVALASTGRWRKGIPAGAAPLVAGMLLGIAITLKYNAVVYAPVALVALAAGGGIRRAGRALLLAAGGLLLPVLAMLALFSNEGALEDLYDATVTYNLLYSGETYSGRWSYVTYLLTFPIRQARTDAIWTIGGLACLILLAESARHRNWRHALPVLWVAAACLSIAINGSRSLPQYFVQAAPALALSAGVAAALLWPATMPPSRWRNAARITGVLLVSFAAWRVTDFEKIPRNAAHDLAYLTGRLPRDEHLARYGGRPEDKYVALSVSRLAQYLEGRTRATDRIYIFGFSPGAYVLAGRVSASRFFWSRPVIVGFNEDAPGYGARGLLGELEAAKPAFVVLQRHDWALPPGDSATYFLTHPMLSAWLSAGYYRLQELGDENYEIWARRPVTVSPEVTR